MKTAEEIERKLRIHIESTEECLENFNLDKTTIEILNQELDLLRCVHEYFTSHPTTLPSDEESLKAIRTEIIKKHLHKESYVDGINVFFSYHQAMEEYASAKIAEMEREMKDFRELARLVSALNEEHEHFKSIAGYIKLARKLLTTTP